MRGASPSTKTLLQAMLAVAAALSLGTSGQDEATPYWGDGSGDAAVVTKQPDGTLETHRIRGRGLGSAGQYEATPYWGDGSGEPVVVTTGRPPGIGQPLPASHRIRGGPIPQPSLQPSTARFDGNVPPYYWRDHTAESPSSVIRAYQEAHPGVAVIPKRTPPADDVITTTVTSSGVTVITRRKPKDIPVVTGVYPQDPDSIAYGLRCVPVEGSHRVGQLTCATAASKPASRKGRERVALVVVGEVKAAMEEVVMDSAHLLVSPLRRDFGDDGVDVYLCVNTPYAVKFAPTWHYGGLIPAAVFEHTATSMADRMRQCWNDVTEHAHAAGHWNAAGNYKWVIRTRPDVVWYQPLPSIAEWAIDAIYTRARRVGMMAVDDEKLSWWAYRDRDFASCDLGCAWRDTGWTSRRDDGACALADDQFAVIPAQFSAQYFGTVKVESGMHYLMPKGHQNCEWAEGEITCQILDAGARLMIAPFSFRINKWQFTHGLGPPFTRPSPHPNVCQCTRCHSLLHDGIDGKPDRLP